MEELVSPSRSPCRGVCFRGRPRDANESRRREREVPFYAARERRRKKREAREHAHVRENARGPRAPVCVHACARERCTVFAPGGNAHTCRRNTRELGRETETERERGRRGRQGDGSCVCTTRRVYQATSVVTAIVPTTSPAGRHPRSIRLSSFPSRPPWSLASRRIASVSPPSWKPFLGVFFLVGDDPSYPPLAFIVSSLVLPRFLSLPPSVQ